MKCGVIIIIFGAIITGFFAYATSYTYEQHWIQKEAGEAISLGSEIALAIFFFLGLCGLGIIFFGGYKVYKDR
jgi:hypothetical protein